MRFCRFWYVAFISIGTANAANVVDQQAVAKAGRDCVELDGLQAHGEALEGCVRKRLGGSAAVVSDVFNELVRNYSCSVDDEGTQPLRTVRMNLPADAFRRCSKVAAVKPLAPVDGYSRGSLPAGNDLRITSDLTVAQARASCNEDKRCAGITFTGEDAEAGGRLGSVWFKSVVETKPTSDPRGQWHAYFRKPPPMEEPCLPEGVPFPEGYDVEIFREAPMLIARVKGLLTDADCKALTESGGDLMTMGRSHTSGGKHSSYRQSYTKNIQPDYRSPSSDVTQFATRLFTAARQLTNFSLHPAGQEPINAVLYREAGDQYRPHCDGTCTEQEYHVGERVATALMPCIVADAGGQTSFTSGHLKVVHRKGDALMFTYMNPATGMMDSLAETQHSGCPLKAGTKWIATQWFREGLSEDKNWEEAAAELGGIGTIRAGRKRVSGPEL